MSDQGKRSWQGRGRRGRPHSDRPIVDRGTAELQAHRARLAAGGDPGLAEYPLGLLLARGLVSREQHEAGCYYAFLYGRAVGRTQVNCSYLLGALAAGYADRHDLTEADLAEIQSLFRKGKNHLLASGRRVCDATENLAVFGRMPRFLDSGRRRPTSACRADEAELAAVRLGLEVLVACYGRAAGRLGRMDLHKSPSLTQAAE
ncbi:MAG: hypothetical protein ACREEV_15120 [Dongiaceae bacterium]